MATRQVRHDTFTRAIADQWCGERCWLNGAPAKITGRLNGFGTVAPDNPDVGTVEYSWHTINRVMRRDRYFGDSE